MGDGKERAAKGARAGRQEVQHTKDSLEALAGLKRRWGMENASDVVRESLERTWKAVKKGGGQ
jgi:hypothetical protein